MQTDLVECSKKQRRLAQQWDKRTKDRKRETTNGADMRERKIAIAFTANIFR